MSQYIAKLFESWKKRILVLLDKSAWMLIAPAFFGLYFIDAATATTLIQWGLFALVLAGVSVMISRIIFPQIDLGALVKRAEESPVGAAIVATGVVTFVALIMLALVIWAKA